MMNFSVMSSCGRYTKMKNLQNSEDMRILEEITVRIEVKDVQSSSTHLLWKNIPLKKKTVGTELSNVSNVQ